MRGDMLGKVYSVPGGPSPHLHLALVEIIAGAPERRYMGVNVYRLPLDMANTIVPRSVTFNQDGSPPIPAAPRRRSGGGEGLQESRERTDEVADFLKRGRPIVKSNVVERQLAAHGRHTSRAE
jgi:hypothetical protein